MIYSLPIQNRFEALNVTNHLGYTVLHSTAAKKSAFEVALSSLPLERLDDALNAKDNSGATVWDIANLFPASWTIIEGLIAKHGLAMPDDIEFDISIDHTDEERPRQ